MIIEYGEPVMVLGGFIGSDPILSSGQLRKKVVSGEVRYFLAGGGGPGGGFGGAGGFAFPGQGAGAGRDVVTGPGLGGLLPGSAAPSASSPPGLGGLLPTSGVPAGGASRGGFGGPFGGWGASSFVALECHEIPQEEWLRGATTTGATSFPGGPTSSTFTLYDCSALVN